LTVAALEERFFARLCTLIGRPDLAERQFDDDQEALAAELAVVFVSKPLAEWLEVADGEDVCVGPVATLAEGAAAFGEPRPEGRAPTLGEHTESWRRALGLAA
jgi:alpha-methylacyl-CoA racemase